MQRATRMNARSMPWPDRTILREVAGLIRDKLRDLAGVLSSVDEFGQVQVALAELELSEAHGRGNLVPTCKG